MVKDTDIAWLAGIVDGEGCFSVKQPVRYGKAGRTCHQVWLVICNTNKPMVDRCADIIKRICGTRPSIRRVWKGDKATRWQYWMNIAKKSDLLVVTQAILPHLTAKRVEGAVIVWFMKRACKQRMYYRTDLDIAVLNTLSAVKKNGGEAPAKVADLLCEVIPSEIVFGHRRHGVKTRRVETRQVSPNDNPVQERPAARVAKRNRVGDIVRHPEEIRGAGLNSQQNSVSGIPSSARREHSQRRSSSPRDCSAMRTSMASSGSNARVVLGEIGETRVEAISDLDQAIPSQAEKGSAQADGFSEGVTTRGPSPNGNDPQERPAPYLVKASG